MSYIVAPSNRPTIDKDPDASLRYGIDVSGLLHDGDSVSAVSVDATGVTATEATFAGTMLTCRVTGGTVGAVGSVRFRWTTTQGDIDDKTLYFNIVQK